MLKIIKLDITIFNHIFDMFQGGLGLHGEFEVNKDGNHRRMAHSQHKKSIEGREIQDSALKA